jgi:hypothetical protein
VADPATRERTGTRINPVNRACPLHDKTSDVAEVSISWDFEVTSGGGMRTRDLRVMSTTVTLADDAAAAIEKLRRERSIGTSEAINELVRAGLSAEHGKTLFRQKTHDLGRGIDFTNVADAIETLDGSNAR